MLCTLIEFIFFLLFKVHYNLISFCDPLKISSLKQSFHGCLCEDVLIPWTWHLNHMGLLHSCLLSQEPSLLLPCQPSPLHTLLALCIWVYPTDSILGFNSYTHPSINSWRQRCFPCRNPSTTRLGPSVTCPQHPKSVMIKPCDWVINIYNWDSNLHSRKFPFLFTLQSQQVLTYSWHSINTC